MPRVINNVHIGPPFEYIISKRFNVSKKTLNCVLISRAQTHQKSNDFKPLKRNQQQKRTHFAKCTRCLRDMHMKMVLIKLIFYLNINIYIFDSHRICSFYTFDHFYTMHVTFLYCSTIVCVLFLAMRFFFIRWLFTCLHWVFVFFLI